MASKKMTLEEELAVLRGLNKIELEINNASKALQPKKEKLGRKAADKAKKTQKEAKRAPTPAAAPVAAPASASASASSSDALLAQVMAKLTGLLKVVEETSAKQNKTIAALTEEVRKLKSCNCSSSSAPVPASEPAAEEQKHNKAYKKTNKITFEKYQTGHYHYKECPFDNEKDFEAKDCACIATIKAHNAKLQEKSIAAVARCRDAATAAAAEQKE